MGVNYKSLCTVYRHEAARSRVMALMLMLVALSNFAAQPARAQSCTADFQCQTALPVGRSSICLGDSLVMQRFQCVGGRCQAIEQGRIQCPGRCDAGSGRCVVAGPVRAPQPTTEPTPRRVAPVDGGQVQCSCKGRILAVTGPAGRVRTCRFGCACKPHPHCLGRRR